MLKAHLPNILTYLKHRITNALTEGFNSKIQWIKSTPACLRGLGGSVV
jgi:transposase